MVLVRTKMFSSPEFAQARDSDPSLTYRSGQTEFYTIEGES